MVELLLQSALAASKSEHLSAQASHIRSNCLAHHNDNNTNTDIKSLLSCSPCYETLLETFRASYLTPPPPSPDDPQHHHQQQEWFTSRRAFLTDLDLTIASAKQYQISPEAVDDRVRAERSSWYVSQVRGSLLRLLVEDRVGFEPQFEKLEYLVAAAAAAEGSADGVALAGTIAELLRTWPLEPENGVRDLPGRLAVAGDQAGRVEVLRGVFFAGEDGAVSEGCQKYVDMLAHQGLSMEQVVDRILEERQAAAGAREQTNKLNQRLDELRRARAAHELQKSKKAQRRESLAQQRVPDELYELPACTVCGETPRTSDFFTCSICTILADRGVRPQPTVFCSQTCEEKGHVRSPTPYHSKLTSLTNNQPRLPTQKPTSAPPPPTASNSNNPPNPTHHPPNTPTPTPTSAQNASPPSSTQHSGAASPAQTTTSSGTARQSTYPSARRSGLSWTTSSSSSMTTRTAVMVMVMV